MGKDEFGPHPSEVEAGRRKTSTGTKVLITCGIGCAVLVVIVVIAGLVGFGFVKKHLEKWTAEFEDRGFKKVTAQELTITNDVTEPTLFVGQMVKITGNADTDVAIIAQMAEIHGTISGKLYFRGQMLVIKRAAELQQGLDVKAQIVTIEGKVSGEITGKYQQLIDQRNETAPEEPAPET